MKEENKKYFFVSAILVLLILIIGMFFSVFVTPIQKLDCSKAPDVYFLTPSEKMNTQAILNLNENALVVIPEDNEIRANTKLLECSGIDFKSYLNLGEAN